MVVPRSTSASVAEIDIGIICACMPLLAPLLPKISLITASWTTYIRSKGRLLRSSRRTQTSDSQQSDTVYEHGLNSDSTQNKSGYVELSERRPKKKTSKSKHWFDRSTMGVSTVGDDVTVTDERALV